jgi:hypothetical protein
LVLLIKDHPDWKEEITIFREVEPYQHISNTRFFDDMFDKFLKGPRNSERVSSEIIKIKTDFMAAVSN